MLGRAVEPPLAHQIAHCRHIFAAEVVSAEDSSFRHRFDLKGTFSSPGDFALDLTLHKLLGFRPHAGALVIVFLPDAGAAPLELLPVEADRVVYAPRSAAREAHPLADFLALVRAGGVA